MNSFKDHTLNPKGIENLAHPHAHSRFELNDCAFEVSLNINQSDKITDYSFAQTNMDAFIPYASALSKIIWGKTITEALSISMNDFIEFFEEDEVFNELREEGELPFIIPPLMTLKEAIKDYSGKNYFSFNTKSDSPIICRCFGIRESEIRAYLTKNTSNQIKDMFVELKAGSGCSTCLSDIQELSIDINGMALTKEQAPVVEIDWSEFHLKINKGLSTYLKMISKEVKVELEYLGVQGQKGHVRILLENDSDISKIILEFLEKNFGEKFYFFFDS